MTAFDKIKENPKMICLVRAVNAGNTSGFLDEEEYLRFRERYAANPLEAIRVINASIKSIESAEKRERYIAEAVTLETITERDHVSTFDFLPGKNETKKENGIPPYIFDGFVDMGLISNEAIRGAREKLVVDKQKLKNKLCDAKLRLADNNGNIAARAWRFVRRNMCYSPAFAEWVSEKYSAGCIGIDKYINQREGICRHFAVFYQLVAQEAGLKSSIERGLGPEGNMHAWNIANENNNFFLVDATKRIRQKGEGNIIMTLSPLIIPGRSIAECYSIAKKMGYEFRPEKAEESYYKYKKLEI